MNKVATARVNARTDPGSLLENSAQYCHAVVMPLQERQTPIVKFPVRKSRNPFVLDEVKY